MSAWRLGRSVQARNGFIKLARQIVERSRADRIEPSRSEQALTASRSLRLMRLRSGELPVFLVTVYPTPGTGSATGTACNTKPRLAILLPRAALRNCARFFRRRNGNAGLSGISEPGPTYAESRLRPIARRRLRILRPFLVAMRARKP